MIYKFQQFNEKYRVESRTQVLNMSREAALRNFAPWYDWDNCKTKMYRSVKGSKTNPDKVKLIDPSKFHRRTLGKPPFYNLLMETWEGYPSRFNSVICSTSKEKLNLFGSLIYRVIPLKENSKVAFAPSTDVWTSFTNYAVEQSSKYKLNLKMNPSDFVYDIASYFYPNREIKSLNDITFDEFKNRVKALEKSNLTIPKWGGGEINFFGTKNNIKEYYKEKFFKDFEGIWEFLVDAYDPDKNGFELLEYNNNTEPSKIIPQGLECWTDAQCLMVYEGFV